MASKLKEIEKEIMQLPEQERAILAKNIILSLDKEEDPDAERLWIKEAERRSREYKSKKVKGKPAEEVFKDCVPPIPVFSRTPFTYTFICPVDFNLVAAT
jgi:putative addiction module component (TIGR02574 family)